MFDDCCMWESFSSLTQKIRKLQENFLAPTQSNFFFERKFSSLFFSLPLHFPVVSYHRAHFFSHHSECMCGMRGWLVDDGGWLVGWHQYRCASAKKREKRKRKKVNEKEFILTGNWERERIVSVCDTTVAGWKKPRVPQRGFFVVVFFLSSFENTFFRRS